MKKNITILTVKCTIKFLYLFSAAGHDQNLDLRKRQFNFHTKCLIIH